MNAWNPDALEKAQVIFRVRSGLMSAADAARQLGMSRKSYYKWELRALEGMMENLCERSPGRPPGGRDGETVELEQRIAQLEKELEERRKAEELRERIKELLEKKE